LRPGVCTSTTRPTNPYLGQLIFETDTFALNFWNGSAWQFLAPTQQRNVLYNGAMQVAQRSNSVASITTNGYYTADRWRHNPTSFGTWTDSVENDAPTGSGFRKSLKVLCTTADASPASTDEHWVSQLLEGQDLQAFKKGTSSAQQFTVSFWVKANVTGTYIFELYDLDNTRQVSKSYTISASGTWEFKTLTLPADTTGAFDNDNATSLYCVFWLGAGSTFNSGTLNTSWASVTNANRAVGQTNLAAATNNYWQVTGVQLNVGGVAAPFEFKSYERDLRECQRYYYAPSNAGGGGADGAIIGGMGYNYSTTNALQPVTLPVPMRTQPTIAVQSTLEWALVNATAQSPSVGIFTSLSGNHYIALDLTGMSGMTAQMAGWLRFATATTGSFAVSAEL
jgi:hypothetical protein